MQEIGLFFVNIHFIFAYYAQIRGDFWKILPVFHRDSD